MNNKNDKEIKWVVDKENIILGVGRSYTNKTLFTLTIVLKVLGALLAIIIGSDLIFTHPFINTFGLLIGSVLYLYGLQLNKYRKEALIEMDKRKSEIEKRN